ncbi:MAG: esterase/lipase family protein [Amnibacterium sp.]
MTPAREAWAWALDYRYALVHQVEAVLDRTDPARYREGGGRRPIVLLPGIWETWHFLKPLIEHLHAAGHPVHVLADLGWNGGSVDAAAALTVAHLREHDLDGAVVVAHSKGGLIGKAAMLDAADGRRLAAMVAISTPFSGSVYARYAPLRSLRAFSPVDPTTLRLAANRDANARITSIWAEFDPHIPGGSELPGATNVRVPTGGHFRILADPRTLHALDEALARAP